MERVNPSTSIEAYKNLKPEKMREIFQKILNALKVLGTANSDTIAKYLTLEHAKIHKRMSEMERAELIYKPGTKSLTRSGSMAFNWSMRGEGLKENAVEHAYKKNEPTAADIASLIINKTAKKKRSSIPTAFQVDLNFD